MTTSRSGADFDRKNQDRYSTGNLSHRFDSGGQWIDLGERAAVKSVAAASWGRPILDIGIGAGRTTSLLTMLTDDYVGIDYSQGLIEQAQQAFPDLDIRFGDARDLSAFSDKKFGLVVFSYNGIDSVGHENRALILSQVCGVLAPDGHFVYSTLNKRGPFFNKQPWSSDRANSRRSLPDRSARFVVRVMLDNREYRRRLSEWWCMRNTVEDHGDWGMGPLGGPGSGLLMHWSTPAATSRELAEAGLQAVAFFDTSGKRLADGEDATSWCFHIVTERAA